MTDPRRALIGRLRQDPDAGLPDDVRQRAERNRAAYQQAAAGLLAELAQAGFAVDTVADLRRGGTADRAAVPVLLRWLPRIADRYVLEDIVRTLAMPWAKAARPALLRLFTAPDLDPAVRWAVGNALEAHADQSVYDELAGIAADPSWGGSRAMVVLALARTKDQRAVQVLLPLLDDDEVAAAAATALGALRAGAARVKLQALLTHRNPEVRKRAKQALAKIDKAGS